LPLLIHEQNARPGLANRLLARHAAVIALSDSRAQSGLKTAGRIVVTGNPLRPELFGHDAESARLSFDLKPEGRVLLVFGGSLGAHHLNSAVLDHADELLRDYPDLQVLHLTGARDLDYARERLDATLADSSRWHLLEYCDRMGEAYAAADLVLSRAGATSLAEITALGKASLLVPYPFAAADEQSANAELLKQAQAAEVWPDARLDEPEFVALLRSLLEDEPRRAQMAERALTFGKADARAQLAVLISGLGIK
jgi:UDP-N-acetylglucosamine--N-acetylmuramyl-(pentapeptide) pyrophosphoryl-undecaprenol N-acetylglucosamine transferase